jgi:hypothetical protein
MVSASSGLGIDAARAAALLGRAAPRPGSRRRGPRRCRTRASCSRATIYRRRSPGAAVRAEALARRGDHATAITFAEAAVASAAATDALLDHARRASRARRPRSVPAVPAGGGRRRGAPRVRALGGEGRDGASPSGARRDTAARLPPRRSRTRSEPRCRGASARTRAPHGPRRGGVRRARSRGDGIVRATPSRRSSHPTGTTYGREQMLLSLERFCVCPAHGFGTSSGDARRHARAGPPLDGRQRCRPRRFDVGEYEKEESCVVELDARGAHSAPRSSRRSSRRRHRHCIGAMRNASRGPSSERALVRTRSSPSCLLPGKRPT